MVSVVRDLGRLAGRSGILLRKRGRVLERNALGGNARRRVRSVVRRLSRLMGGAGMRPLLLLLRVLRLCRLMLLLMMRLLLLLRLLVLVRQARRSGMLLYLSGRRALLREMASMLCHRRSR